MYRKIPSEMGGGGGSYKGFEEDLSGILKDEFVKKCKIEARKNVVVMTFTFETFDNELIKIRSRYGPVGLLLLRIYDPDTDEWRVFFKKGNE